MLIQDYFRRNLWILVTVPVGGIAAFVYWRGDRSSPDGLTGGSTLGLWYGVAGTACLLAAWLILPLERRKEALIRHGWPRSWWLKGHVWLSLLSVVLILCHSAGRLGGQLELLLMLAFALTMLTGFVGLGLQYWLPHRSTRSFPHDIPAGQIGQVCQEWRKRADALIEKICAPLAPDLDQEARQIYDQQVRPALYEKYPWRLAFINPLQKAEKALDELMIASKAQTVRKDIESLQKICQTRRQLGHQQWLHGWLHGWLLIHVPLSVALLILGAVHAVMSLYY